MRRSTSPMSSSNINEHPRESSKLPTGGILKYSSTATSSAAALTSSKIDMNQNLLLNGNRSTLESTCPTTNVIFQRISKQITVPRSNLQVGSSIPKFQRISKVGKDEIDLQTETTTKKKEPVPQRPKLNINLQPNAFESAGVHRPRLRITNPRIESLSGTPLKPSPIPSSSLPPPKKQHKVIPKPAEPKEKKKDLNYKPKILTDKDFGKLKEEMKAKKVKSSDLSSKTVHPDPQKACSSTQNHKITHLAGPVSNSLNHRPVLPEPLPLKSSTEHVPQPSTNHLPKRTEEKSKSRIEKVVKPVPVEPVKPPSEPEHKKKREIPKPHSEASSSQPQSSLPVLKSKRISKVIANPSQNEIISNCLPKGVQPHKEKVREKERNPIKRPNGLGDPPSRFDFNFTHTSTTHFREESSSIEPIVKYQRISRVEKDSVENQGSNNQTRLPKYYFQNVFKTSDPGLSEALVEPTRKKRSATIAKVAILKNQFIRSDGARNHTNLPESLFLELDRCQKESMKATISCAKLISQLKPNSIEHLSSQMQPERLEREIPTSSTTGSEENDQTSFESILQTQKSSRRALPSTSAAVINKVPLKSDRDVNYQKLNASQHSIRSSVNEYTLEFDSDEDLASNATRDTDLTSLNEEVQGEGKEEEEASLMESTLKSKSESILDEVRTPSLQISEEPSRGVKERDPIHEEEEDEEESHVQDSIIKESFSTDGEEYPSTFESPPPKSESISIKEHTKGSPSTSATAPSFVPRLPAPITLKAAPNYENPKEIVDAEHIAIPNKDESSLGEGVGAKDEVSADQNVSPSKSESILDEINTPSLIDSEINEPGTEIEKSQSEKSHNSFFPQFTSSPEKAQSSASIFTQIEKVQEEEESLIEKVQEVEGEHIEKDQISEIFGDSPTTASENQFSLQTPLRKDFEEILGFEKPQESLPPPLIPTTDISNTPLAEAKETEEIAPSAPELDVSLHSIKSSIAESSGPESNADASKNEEDTTIQKIAEEVQTISNKGPELDKTQDSGLNESEHEEEPKADAPPSNPDSIIDEIKTPSLNNSEIDEPASPQVQATPEKPISAIGPDEKYEFTPSSIIPEKSPASTTTPEAGGGGGEEEPEKGESSQHSADQYSFEFESEEGGNSKGEVEEIKSDAEGHEDSSDNSSLAFKEMEEEWFEDDPTSFEDPEKNILKKEAVKILSERVKVENKIRALESGNLPSTSTAVQSMSFNDMMIIDKPPPPYSPPSPESLSLSLSMRSFAISCEEARIAELVEEHVDSIWETWVQNKTLPEPENESSVLLETSMDKSNGGEGFNEIATKALSTLLQDLVVDTTREVLHVPTKYGKSFLDMNRAGPLAFQAAEHRIPKTKSQLVEAVSRKVTELTEVILDQDLCYRSRRLTKWSSRARDPVDQLLAEELVEEDKEFTEIWPEEMIVLEKVKEAVLKRAIREVCNAFKVAYS